MRISDIAHIDDNSPQTVVEQILDSFQAEMYVSDIESNSVLFCNRALRQARGIRPRDMAKKKCWEAVYGLEGPCPHCALAQIRKTPGRLHSSTVVDGSSGRFLEHNDCLIDWLDGKKGHLRYTLDVTRQEVMHRESVKKSSHDSILSEITTQIITSNKLGVIIDETMERLGRHFEADRVHLLGIHESTRTYVSASEYLAGGRPPFAQCVGDQRIRVSNYIYYRALRGQCMVESDLDSAQQKNRYRTAGLLGIRSMILVPVFIGERLWGVLCVNDCTKPRAWDGQDVELCRQIATIMGIAIERRNIENELSNTKETLQTILDHVPAAISWKDTNLRLLGCNKNYREIFHLEDREVAGKTISDYLPTSYTDGATEAEQKIMEGQFDGEPSVRYIKDAFGNDRWVRTTRVPIRNEYGIITLLLGVTEDVTTDVQLEAYKAAQEDKLLRKAESALEKSRAKTDYLSQISHEIRTPLNAIIGMVQVAEDTDDPDLIAQCLRQITPASKTLLGIINDVLDISKIEANKMEVQNDEFHFEEMLLDAYSVAGAEAELKDIHLIPSIGVDIPGVLKGDSRHISQILTNLLSNALKFTPHGGIVELSAEIQEETNHAIVIRYDVSDTGIGLTEEECKRLFHAYEQADGNIRTKYGGTGLGLNIAQKVANLLRSEIRVESEAGHGSTFSFSTRLQKIPGEQIERDSLDGLSLLVAGSNHAAVLPLLHLLQALGARVYMAYTILQTVKALETTTGIDIVLIDFALSEFDEAEAMNAVCEIHPARQTILLTSGPAILEI